MIESTRRHFLRISSVDFLYCCAALPGLAQQAVKVNGAGPQRLNWDAFIERLEFAATQQRRPRWDQSRYVQHIAVLTRSLKLNDRFLTTVTSQYRDIHRSRPEFSELLRTADVQVSLITFERGETIPHHDHPDMTGVMVCAGGSVHVKEYDPVGVPSPSGCLLKSSGQQQLGPGSVTTLTSRSRNVHGIRATAFSQIVDIFTPPYNDERKKSTRWFEVERFPVKGSLDTFVAHQVQPR